MEKDFKNHPVWSIDACWRQSDKRYALIYIDTQVCQPDPLGFENYYEFDSCLRIFHAGFGHKTLPKLAVNDVGWRVAA